MDGDAQLLRRYLEDHSEVAFTELVQRHVNLVYHTALRRVGGDRHLAEDVTQGVFTDLARKASSLQGRAVLAGWLYTSTRFAAAQAVRTAQRQRIHAREAHLMQEINSASAANWEHLRPVIDEALDELTEAEREIVLLRFFEGRPLAEVGTRFALSPDAARMRVDRALDKLHGLLAKRGITSTAVALAAIFAGQSGLAAPAGLTASIVAQVFGSTGAVVTAGTIALWKIMAGLGVVLLGAGIVVYRVAEPPPRPLPEPPARVTAAIAPVRVSSPAPVIPAQSPARPVVVVPASKAESGLEVTSGRSSETDFSSLPGRQKNVLKHLWVIQQFVPDQGPVRRGFAVRPEAPKFDDIEAAVMALQDRGLVGVGAQKGVVFLTKRGKAFCEAHLEEIDAYVLIARPD